LFASPRVRAAPEASDDKRPRDFGQSQTLDLGNWMGPWKVRGSVLIRRPRLVITAMTLIIIIIN
jgi:hypothetical protein